MSSTYYTDDRATALSQLCDGGIASSLGHLGKAARVVNITWDELKNIKTLSKLDDYQLDDIGISRSEIRPLSRKSAAHPTVDLRAFE